MNKKLRGDAFLANESDLKKERQAERLKFIDLCAYVLGYVNRSLLTARFNIKGTYATTDIKEYQEQSLGRLSYNTSLKAYEPVDRFKPMFDHLHEDAFMLISEGTQKICFIPKLLDSQVAISIHGLEPKLELVAPVLRAIGRGLKVEIDYISNSSGQTKRLIAPHSLITAGNFKYVRAFDHKTGEFRSFKLNRIMHARLTNEKIDIEMQKNSDPDWNEVVTLVLRANQSLKHKEAIEFDYGMVNGELEVPIKKALLPFFLMDWNIAPQNQPNLPPVRFPLEIFKII